MKRKLLLVTCCALGSFVLARRPREQRKSPAVAQAATDDTTREAAPSLDWHAKVKRYAQEQELSEASFYVDPETQKKRIIALVKKGVEFLSENRPEVAFNAFTRDRKFLDGELHLFVYDDKGTVLVDTPYDTSLLWANRYEFRNTHDKPVIKEIINVALKGGGWYEYHWQDARCAAYIEMLEKEGKKYIVAAAWYPRDKEHGVQDIVQGGVAYFNEHGREKAFRDFSNPFGQFVEGDFYLFSYDMEGNCLAHGDNAALVGRDWNDLKDKHGNYLVRGLIKKGQEGGGWVDYTWKNAPKRGYLERVSDRSGDYIIGSGYYPLSSRDKAVEMTKGAVKYFEEYGRERASHEISTAQGQFIFGDLYVFMFDYEGNCLAHGGTPALVGQKLIGMRAPDDIYIVREMIERAKEGGGWLEYRWKNDLMVSYVEPVHDRQGDYVIGCGLYPDTHREDVIETVRLSIEYLRNHTKQEALREFSLKEGRLINGYIKPFVFNMQGDCLVYGNNYGIIWQNFNDFKDETGKNVIDLLFKRVENEGGGWVEYKSRGRSRVAYVRKVKKDDEELLIGAAFGK